MIRKGSRYPRRLSRDGRDLEMLIRGEWVVWIAPDTVKAISQEWLDENVKITSSVSNDSTARWFELEIVMPDDFTGSPEDGWSNGTINLALDYTTDLSTWETIDWVSTPGTTPESADTGKTRYFARASVPVMWFEVMLDLQIGSNRSGQSITEIHLFDTLISLPNYPYAMPADAAALEADLIAEGFTGATVSVTSAALSVTVRNHLSSGAFPYDVTMSGSSVTAVAPHGGSTISLPSYPYSMPSQESDLQADLRTAGVDGAVVRLYGDQWTIDIPDWLTSGLSRSLVLFLDPGDPYPAYDLQGNYIGENPDNSVVGTFGNVRDPMGDPIREELQRAFAVMRIVESLP